MKKIEVIIIGLLLIMATAFTIVSAETETTYHCYTNGEWGTCTPSEAIIAEEAMTKETPREVTHEEFNAIIDPSEAIIAREAMTSETPREVTHDEFTAIIRPLMSRSGITILPMMP